MEFRQLKPDSRENLHFSLGEIYRDRKMYNDFQRSKLIPGAFALRHGKEPEDGNTAAMEWIGKKDAEKVEEYILSHPEEEIDMDDTEQVQAFLFRMDPEIKKEMLSRKNREVTPTLH